MKAKSKAKLFLFFAKNKKWLIPAAVIVVAVIVYFVAFK